jgi:alpha-ketoglutarate-dependent taurine dioxygenase
MPPAVNDHQPDFIQTPDQQEFDSIRFPLVMANKTSGQGQALDSLATTIAWLQDQQPLLERALESSGALLFRGFPIDSATAFDAFSAAFGYKDFTYQESLSNAVRVNLTERVFTANEAPPEVEIYLHHEMAQTPVSPGKLFFYCHSAAAAGGATSLCRSDRVYAGLRAMLPEWADKFETFGVRYTTNMPVENNPTSGQGRSWKSTLSVDDRRGAEAKLQGLGYSWEWQVDGGLRATTPVLPAVVDLGDGRKAFYNQLIAAYMGWAGVKARPESALLLGDGTAIPAAVLEQLVLLADSLTFDLVWQDGDVALIDNRCTMHGRRPYSGDRKRQVLVALAAQ